MTIKENFPQDKQAYRLSSLLENNNDLCTKTTE